MLFNSFQFLFIFFPITLVIYYWVARKNQVYAAAWLTVASLAFYGWWSPADIGLLIASVLFNYLVSQLLVLTFHKNILYSKIVLFFGVSSNLILLFHFKYSAFIIENINLLIGSSITRPSNLLPLGISFFTFTQIAYLVDTYRDRTKPFRFTYYALFVTYFPHLVAGPILHHREILPQFSSKVMYRFNYKNLAVGLTLFTLGIFKKLFFADYMARFVGPVFGASGHSLTLLEAWGGALAYTLQIYFDFSGYSDMAVGLSRMLGAHIPLNFNSPYKSKNITDFWRRWHISLSRFLRDYLYISLGGNRKGRVLRYINLLTTMLLGGLWHGAGWTFVAWGLLHGLYLVINHAWIYFKSLKAKNLFIRIIDFNSQTITFISVVLAWVFFRAPNIDSAIQVIRGMIGLNGFSIHNSPYFAGGKQALPIIALLIFAFKTPNTQEWLRKFKPDFTKITQKNSRLKNLEWYPSLIYALLIGLILAACLIQMKSTKSAEFIYYNF